MKLEQQIIAIDQKITANTKIVTQLRSEESAKTAENYHKVLIDLGWRVRKTYDKSAVASFESHLIKNDIRADIIAANFLGNFIHIDFF